MQDISLYLVFILFKYEKLILEHILFCLVLTILIMQENSPDKKWIMNGN